MTDSNFVICPNNLTKTPRDYQVNTPDQVARYLEQGYHRIMIQGPTGCGKTYIAKLIALSKSVRSAINHSEKKLRILFISAKQRLNRQAAKEFKEVADHVEIITQSAFSDIPESVISEGWDLCYIDECHREAMATLQKKLHLLIRTPIIGFTASDVRGDGMSIKFDRKVVAITESAASHEGYIEKVGINSIVDCSGKDKSSIVQKTLSQYHRHMGNTLVFFDTQAQAEKTYRYATKTLGLSCGIIEQTTSENELDAMLHRLSTGDIQFLFNCKKISEGVDTVNVTDVIIASVVQTSSELLQKIGRARRPDSPCQVWEFINPFKESISTAKVISGIKYEYSISFHRNQWTERHLSGEDITRGNMSDLRHKNLRALTHIGRLQGELLESESAPIKQKTSILHDLKFGERTSEDQPSLFQC